MTIGPFQVDHRQDIPSFECEWDQYPLDEYNYPWPYFYYIRRLQHLVNKTFQHEYALEDHQMNAKNDYDVHIRDYCRMTLYLVEKGLKIKIPLKIV